MRAAACLFLLFAVSLAGCRPAETASAVGRADRIAAGECIINIGSDPSSLDPGLVTDIPAAKALLCLMRGLIVLDDNCDPHAELAESWEISDDGRVYTFKLRDAHWSNGLPVTADDFVYAWTRRVLQPAFASQYAYQLFYLKGARAYYQNTDLGVDSIGVRALAPDRLRVELEAPAPFFLQLLAHHSYFPICAEVDRADPEWHRNVGTYVGCGPYLLEHYVNGSELIVRKNRDYWNADAVHMNRVTLRMIEQESTERIAYDNGEIDATNTVPLPDIEQLRGRPDYREKPELTVYYLYVYCQRPPLNDPRIRRALALAIDRRSIVDHILRAGQRPALHLAPPELYKGGAPATPLKDADFEQARQLLADAGFTGGKGLPTFRYLYNTTEGHKAIALAIQETWRRELGIDVTLENQEFKVTIDRRRSGDFDISRAGWVGDFADPINFLDLFDSAS
jgi:oligopeptide transport system substrate-binding protein